MPRLVSKQEAPPRSAFTKNNEQETTTTHLIHCITQKEGKKEATKHESEDGKRGEKSTHLLRALQEAFPLPNQNQMIQWKRDNSYNSPVQTYMQGSGKARDVREREGRDGEDEGGGRLCVRECSHRRRRKAVKISLSLSHTPRVPHHTSQGFKRAFRVGPRQNWSPAQLNGARYRTKYDFNIPMVLL